MNIILLSSDYLPNIGGVSTHVHELARTFMDQGHQVRVVTFRSHSWHPRTWFHGWTETDGVRAYNISLAALPGGHARFWRLRRIAKRLLKHCGMQHQPVVLHVHDCDSGQYIAEHVKG